MLVAHGAAFIKMKTDGVIARRASVALRVASFLAVVLFVLAGVLVASTIGGFHITHAAPTDTVANPLLRTSPPARACGSRTTANSRG